MRPLLQHASRSLTAHVAFVTPSARLVGGSSRADSSICQRWQNRAASTPLRRNNEAPLSLLAREKWLCRPISSSARWMEERKPPQSSESISMPPPASEPVAVPPGQAKESSPPDGTAQSPVRTQDELNILLEKKIDAHSGVDSTQPLDSQETTTRKNDTLADNITRVPDEQLPSHGERQRWAFSKRFSEVMDDLLPKLATVTQKVNNYTGTDYSGVEALRREIKEQGTYYQPHNDPTTTSHLTPPRKPRQSPPRSH
jgi:sensitive to high expression protein 9